MSTTPDGSPAPHVLHPETGKVPSSRSFVGPAIILLAALVAIAPQLFRGNTCGHDFDYHLVSWFDALQSWREGILYPRWTPSANFGAGEPRFVFYPPLTWMLGAALAAVLPWKLVPITLTFLTLAGTGLAARALARQVLSNGPATLAGCAALFSGYTLFTAYERTAFGELTGGFWIPLLLLFILRDRRPSGSAWQRCFDGSTAPLAVALAGAWFSDIPLGILASYLMAGMALTAALLWRSWAPILRSTVAAALGFALTAIYMVPAVFEQRWITVQQATTLGYRIQDSWLFARHADQSLELHDLELFKISTIAVTMIAVALAGVLVSRLRGNLPGKLRRWLPLALVPALVLFLQLPVSQSVWDTLPKLRFLQFPWRWLVALEAPMGVFFASAVWVARWRWRLAVLSACAAVFLAATIAAGFNFFQACDADDAVWAMLDTYHSGVGFEGGDEFEPPGADNSLLAMDLPDACLTTSPTTVLGQGPDGADLEWSPDQKSCEATFSMAKNQGKAPVEHLRVNAFIQHAGYLILRLRSYPPWQVRVNGRILRGLPEREDGLMAVPVPQGKVGLAVDWTTTRDVIAGRWLSGIAIVLITALCLFERISVKLS